jgi:hypothetical protein
MKHTDFIFIQILGFTLNATCQVQQATANCFDSIVLRHFVVPAGPVPTAFDPDGVYPYVSYWETSARPEPVKTRFIALENQLLKILIYPDLGGKVTSIVHKPSGMEELGEAFEWAIDTYKGENSDTWYYYYGTWLAGRGEADRAIEVLSGSRTGLAMALLARLLQAGGDPSGAKELLLSTEFQKIHQRYIRTDLWRQICELLNEPFYPIPEQLGEDRLARFGAYREFEQ